MIAMMFSACSKKLTYDAEKGAYIGRAGTFYRASSNYLAVGIDSAEELAKLRSEGSEDILLYPVCKPGTDVYMDSELWMADENYQIYYAEGVELPLLWDMQIHTINIVERKDILFGVGQVTDAEDIQKVIDRYRNGVFFLYNESKCNFRVVTEKNYDLAFASENYPCLYYMLRYYEYENAVTYSELVEDPENFVPRFDFEYVLEDYQGDTYVRYTLGKAFIFDRETGRCYPIDDLKDIFFATE